MVNAVRTRFAPSPTGYLHLGNVRTALFNYLLAAGQGGDFVIRCEDTDRDRSREDYLAAALEDLEWLGLDWLAGPGRDDGRGPYRQSRRATVYDEYFAQLEADGRAYPCFCTQAELAVARKTQLAAGRAPRYPGTCRELSAAGQRQRLLDGARPTLRFRVDAGAPVTFDDLVRGEQSMARGDIGDFIIRRSDGTPSFFFSNAVDDALMGITDVLRGEDHLTNTPRQLLLLDALGLPAPRYGHIALVIAADGTPLSKRHGSIGVRDMAEQGYFADALCNHLARLGHKFDSDDFMRLEELAAGFATPRLGRAPAKHDPVQLMHWQREALHRRDDAELLQWMGSARTRDGRDVGERLGSDAVEFVRLIRGNVEMPADAAHWAELLLDDPPRFDDSARAVLAVVQREFIDAALAQLDDAADFRSWSKATGKATGASGKTLFMPLRAALTGDTHGPELNRVFDYLGKEGLQARLQAAAQYCETGDVA
ncbi:MAG: glutamate--tRNA ligase [Gammaproteobacteria bacterium]|nr:glutamate--tRNA ligase [Gammaproteobacteria bacterium]NNF62056.1 glutamate--tRNA ligase [Gammaproteobacteria bacterium]NNM20667.1 glutamate--tRNA ligase [Gammaproteobacteria bacterium]